MTGDYVIAQAIVWALGWVAKSKSKSEHDLTHAVFVVLLLPFTFGLADREMRGRPALDRIGAVVLGLVEWVVAVTLVAIAVGEVRSLLY
jgi:hypothetical protein